MKCKKMQEQKEINLQLENKKKVQRLKEKGITLIALVVTIIILLILAGVTLSMALSGDGLFNMARKAATDYNQKSVEEKLQILYAEKIMEDNDSNTKVKTDVTDVLEEMAGGEITEEKIEEFNKLLEQYNEEVKGIKTADELTKIGTDDKYPIDGVYVQLSDIEQLSTPIGTVKQPFKGVYNGNGKSIKKLEIEAKEDYTGMFRVNEGTVKNVTIEDCQITSEKGVVGGIAGENRGSIENCTISKGNITSNGYLLDGDTIAGSRVGGICGYNLSESIIYKCTNFATVTGVDRLVGGICGFNRAGDFEMCVNGGKVSGLHQVGGIIGNSDGTKLNRVNNILDCRNNGSVESTRESDSEMSACGGVVGYLKYAYVKTCRNDGDIHGLALDVGGIAGYAIEKTNIENSSNYGRVERKKKCSVELLD